MKKITSLVLVALLIFGCITTTSAIKWGDEYEGDNYSYNEIYIDVQYDHWAYEETKRCKEKGWFSGYPDGSFRPEASITRAEAIKVIVSFLGRKLEEVRISNYHDVGVTEWYAPYIHAGEDLFPLKWKNNNAFQPDMPMTREDTIYALVVALQYDDKIKFADESVLNMFSDRNSITNTMKPYVAVAISEGLVSGYHDNTIRAQDSLTRAQFAALLYRASFVGINDKKEAVLQKVVISPSTDRTMTVGDSFTFTAKAVYSDNSEKIYSDIKPYDADYSGIVKIEGNTVVALKEGTCTIKFDCEYPETYYIKVSVTNPKDKPVIKIYDVPEQTSDEYIQIKGVITDKTETRVDVTCNRNDVLVENNTFTYGVSLDIGENEFNFVAINEYGNESTKLVKIYRKESKAATVEMVNVIGKTELNARSIIESLGLRVSVETVWDENVSQGTVIEQSISSGQEVEIGDTVSITVSGGKNEWVGWSETLPSYVNSGDYVIEEKTQYKYRELKTTTDTSSSKSGWTLISENSSWGNWSSWSTSCVNGSSTREVETRSVADPQKTKTQWHYTRYYGKGSSGKYVSWPWPGTHSKTYQESGWRDTPMENRGRADDVDATVYKDPGDPISIWWWNETTRTVNLPATYHTEYRYRDKISTYVFSQWSNWSDWTDRAISKDEGVEVETRTVYRYKFR